MSRIGERAAGIKAEEAEKDYFFYHPDAEPSKTYTCPLTGEKLYEFTSPCGARLYYMQKDVHLSAGVASVPYGGADDHVSTKMGRRVVSLAGCAHFAEHMLFTGKGGRLERFIALGADARGAKSDQIFFGVLNSLVGFFK